MDTLAFPPSVTALANEAEKHGCTLYAVGGCVRDALLGRTLNDYDLTGAWEPQRMRELLGELSVPCETVNEQLGTLLLRLGDRKVEYTPFRTESYGAGGAHRPEQVAFTTELNLDAFRRDFSVNALYCELTTGRLIDPTGGLADLEKRQLRTTAADPQRILRDDGLRLLRLVRFSAALDFTVEEGTEQAARENAALLDDVAQERRMEELSRILTGERVFGALEQLRSLGLWAYLIPEFLPCDGMEQRRDHHRYDVLTHMFHACENTPPLLPYRLMGLLHDVGKPPCKEETGKLYLHDVYSERLTRGILKRLCCSNALIERVCFGVRMHTFDLWDGAKEDTLRRRFCDWGEQRVEDLIVVREADVRGSGYELDFTAKRWRTLLAAMREEGVPFRPGQLCISGNEIMRELKLSSGKEVGRIKHQLLLHCAVHPEDNERSTLLTLLTDYR